MAGCDGTVIALAYFAPHRAESPARAKGSWTCTHFHRHFLTSALIAAIIGCAPVVKAVEPPASKPPAAAPAGESIPPVQPRPAPEPELKPTPDTSIETWSIAVTAAGTIVIALFTISLARSTRRLWDEAKASSATANATAEAAKANAEAARDSVEALRAAERAYVFAEVVPEVWGSSPGASSGWINATVRFWNHGKTPAVILLIRASMRIGGGIPTGLIEFPGSESRLPEGLAIPSAERYEVPVKQLVDNVPDVEGLNVIVYCVGKIEYADVLGNKHATSFCWHYIPNRHNWELARESQLNERT